MSFRAFFDESHSDGYYCLAGYILEKQQAKKMQVEWDAMLRRYRVPYFRMVEVAHNRGVIRKAGLSARERIAIASEAIEITRKRNTYGLSLTIDHATFQTHIAPRIGTESPYVFCTRMCLHTVGVWATRNKFGGKIAFYFEAGEEHQGEAGELMLRLSREPGFEEFCDFAHAYVKKRDMAGTQAADLLAWHSVTHLKHIAKGLPTRADFAALLRKTEEYGFLYWNAATLKEIASDWDKQGATPQDWYGAATVPKSKTVKD